MEKNSDKKTIALIDDDESIREVYKTALAEDGLSVFEASNGKDGLLLIKKHKPDAVVCDVVMPDGDGFFVLEKAKKDPLLKDIPILILTQLDNNDDRSEAMSLGADDYMIKFDITPSQVVKKVRTMITSAINKKKVIAHI